VLGDVEETIFVAEEEDDEDQEPRVRTVKKQSEMLFVRGTMQEMTKGMHGR
jgi:U6 snRNA-associated Sm-like protein LSm3